MGLDMNLYLRAKDNRDELDCEIAYWGKRWDIFWWFKRNVGEIEDCKLLRVTKEHLLKLRDDCIAILQKATDGKKVTDMEVAQKYIPLSPHSDPNEEYDEYYVGHIISTLDEVNRVLYFTDFDTHEILFYASW